MSEQPRRRRRMPEAAQLNEIESVNKPALDDITLVSGQDVLRNTPNEDIGTSDAHIFEQTSFQQHPKRQTVSCPKCGAKVSERAVFCGRCGYILKKADRVKRRIKKTICALLVVMLFAVLLITSLLAMGRDGGNVVKREVGLEAFGSNERQKQIKIVDVATGDNLAAAVYSDGTVVLSGEVSGEWGQIPSFADEVAKWRNIISVAVGDTHIVGLKKDGTVVAAGKNTYGQCNVDSWKDVKQISASDYATSATREDGTVYSTGIVKEIFRSGKTFDSKDVKLDVSDCKYIDKVSVGYTGLLLQRKDRVCSTIGVNLDGAYLGVSGWSNIIDIAHGLAHCIGLQADGTVVASGVKDARTKVSSWKNVKQVAAGSSHSVGLKNDGTVLATGNKSAACQTTAWSDIVKICAGGNSTIGITTKGTVVFCGTWNAKNTPDIESWNGKVNQ